MANRMEIAQYKLTSNQRPQAHIAVADLAGLTRFEFVDLLRYNGESIFHYSADELDEIDRDSERLGKILNAI